VAQTKKTLKSLTSCAQKKLYNARDHSNCVTCQTSANEIR